MLEYPDRKLGRDMNNSITIIDAALFTIDVHLTTFVTEEPDSLKGNQYRPYEPYACGTSIE